jgi:hypothetical protein
MTAPNLNAKAPFISAVTLTIGAAAESIATSGTTIPSNAGEIWLYVPAGDSIHWQPSATPTSTVGNAATANKWFMLTHAQHGALIISDDGSDVSVVAVFMRGAGSALSNASNAVPN